MDGQQKTILIVDDIAYVRKTLKTILQSCGFKVVAEAESGEEAIRLYRELSPDVVTMDLVMPKMNGIEATRSILAYDPSAKVVVLSAMLQEALVTEAILAGAKDYIVKPFQKEDVVKILNHVISDGQRERLSIAGKTA